MDEQAFKKRTKQLALDAIALTESLPRTRAGEVIGRQLLRCSTSVGANYRASCRARSVEELVSKLAIVEEEADEALYWMELLVESNLVSGERLRMLMRETNEILAMTVASKKTLKNRIGARGFSTGRKSVENRES